MEIGYIYVISSPSSDSLYVGQTLQNPPEGRWKDHKKDTLSGGTYPVHHFIRKYPDAVFTVVVVCFGLEDTLELEKRILQEIPKEHQLNLIPGGRTSPFSDPRIKELVRLHLKKLHKSEGFKDRLRKLNSSPEHINQIRNLAQKNLIKLHGLSKERKSEIGKMGALAATALLSKDQHIERMKRVRAARTEEGYRRSEETKAKISASKRGKTGFTHSEETKSKMSNSKKQYWESRRLQKDNFTLENLPQAKRIK